VGGGRQGQRVGQRRGVKGDKKKGGTAQV